MPSRFVEQLRGELQHDVVAERPAEQHGAAGGATIGGHAEGGNRGAQQVEEIPEVRVVAQHRVAVDGCGQDLVDGERGADGRYHQHVHVSPNTADGGLELLQRLQCRERVDGGVPVSAREDLAHHG